MTRGEQSTQRDGSKEDGVRRDAAGGQWGLLDHGKPQWGVRGHGLNDGSQRWRGKKREQLRGRASLGKQRQPPYMNVSCVRKGQPLQSTLQEGSTS